MRSRSKADLFYMVETYPQNDQAGQINQGVYRKSRAGKWNTCNPGGGTECAPQSSAKRETTGNSSNRSNLKKTGDA